MFEALPEAQLEIYLTNFSTVALVEIATCAGLAVKEFRTDQTCIAQWRDFADKQIEALTLQKNS